MKQKENNLSNVLLQERERYGLSHKRAAILLGIQDPQAVTNWEEGLATPSFENIFRIINLYQVDPRIIWPDYYLMIREQMLAVWDKYSFSGLPTQFFSRSNDDND